MENQSNNALTIINQATKLPGVRVSRDTFLLENLKVSPSDTALLLEKGPLNSGLFTKEEIKKIAEKISKNRINKSTLASFATGIPGGFTMLATIPTDMLQFWGFNIRLAQEIAYLYGYEDFWKREDSLSIDTVESELILFMGVMLGVAGAASVTRYLSLAIAQNIATNLPKKALTRTAWYPILKKLAAYVGVKLTKDTTARGISKVVPVLGGVVSGTITYRTMKSMTARLYNALDEAAVDYSIEEQEKDIETIKREMPDIYDAIFS